MAPGGSCPEPSCYSQIRLAEINGLPNSGFIVFVHRDELLIEMTEEYVIYHGGLRALQLLWYSLASAMNNQLRTGADKGNPTV